MGSIGPKGKISKSRKGMKRASSWKISMPNLVACKNCGDLMVSHRVCKACGSYNNKEVIRIAE